MRRRPRWSGFPGPPAGQPLRVRRRPHASSPRHRDSSSAADALLAPGAARIAAQPIAGAALSLKGSPSKHATGPAHRLSFEYGHPDLYQNSQADTMLQDVTMASSTGTLAQIGLLSHYATELFQALFTTAHGWQDRLDSASSRVRALNAQRPRVCDGVARCDGDSVHRSGTLPEREHPQRVQFTVETMPRGLRERRRARAAARCLGSACCRRRCSRRRPSSEVLAPRSVLDQWAQEELRKMEELKRRHHEASRAASTRAPQKRGSRCRRSRRRL